MNSIAVLLTCHNRKEITTSCLQRLFDLKPNVDVFCVDDASVDGTPEAISRDFPQVHLIHGDGNLFWCRGMNLAWEIAREHGDYDCYLWLNDDLFLYDNAFVEILNCSKLNNDKAIIGGIVQGVDSKKAVYGGFDKNKNVLNPNGEMQEIHNLNGNFVLVPRYVFETLGFFDKMYHHDVGDVDYGLMAKKQNIKVLTTRSFIGSTSEGLKSMHLRIRRDGVNLSKRFKYLYSPLGCNPKIDFYFLKKHRGLVLAILDYSYLHLINLMPDWLFYLVFPKYK